MNKKDKLKLATDLKIETEFEVPNEKVIEEIKEIDKKDSILFGTELYKYNERGWKNKRKIYLTYKRLFNTDTKGKINSNKKLHRIFRYSFCYWG